MTAARLRRGVLLVLAVVLVAAVPLAPGAVAEGSPAALMRLPMESIIVLLLLAAIPSRAARIAVAGGFGLVVVLALALAGIDAGFEWVLNIHFDPRDSQRLGDAFGVVKDSIGLSAANASLVLLAVAAAAVAVVLPWAALRVAAAVRADRVRGSMATTTAATAWLIVAVMGSQLTSAQPAVAAASLETITAAASRATAGLAAEADLPREIATDPYRDASGLLTALKGKDVIFAFIESYGQVAVQGSGFSAGVAQTLRDGEARLTADGYRSQSAFLTSPTFGGVSWLAHATLQTGLWVDRQTIYDKVVRSDRLTLSRAFGEAGWRTVSVVPSDTRPWPVGSSFYRFDTLDNAYSVGYRGPSFGYARIPDQYTWKHFAEQELAEPHQPVMAEIDLVSSHTPWAPLPRLVPWSEVGDGSVFDPQPGEGQAASVVWRDQRTIRQAYAESIQYSLGAMLQFLHESDDPDLVLVVLGDHQPATIVSGQGASHDVPISVISKDPAVFRSIAGWDWQDGLLPAPDAPVWPMSAFRDRFLAAFSPSG